MLSNAVINQKLTQDFDSLPPKYPGVVGYENVRMIPEYLGSSGNFYNATSHHVMMIGECIAVGKVEDGTFQFCDSNSKWWARYVPHRARN